MPQSCREVGSDDPKRYHRGRVLASVTIRSRLRPSPQRAPKKCRRQDPQFRGSRGGSVGGWFAWYFRDAPAKCLATVVDLVEVSVEQPIVNGARKPTGALAMGGLTRRSDQCVPPSPFEGQEPFKSDTSHLPSLTDRRVASSGGMVGS
jgi:hypothetical protein